MASDKNIFGVVTVRTDAEARMGSTGYSFADARFTVDGPVSVYNKNGDMVGFFPIVSSVTLTPNKDA